MTLIAIQHFWKKEGKTSENDYLGPTCAQKRAQYNGPQEKRKTNFSSEIINKSRLSFRKLFIL